VLVALRPMMRIKFFALVLRGVPSFACPESSPCTENASPNQRGANRRLRYK
jgi:hypothetical protein